MKPHARTIINVLRKKPHAVGAEIGVFRGFFAMFLLRSLPNIQTYYCVDPWELYPDHLKTLQRNSAERSSNHENVFRQFQHRTKQWKNKIVVVRKLSQDALVDVADGSLDWVFIDANHSYPYSREDIIGWSKKVKVGGLISGHDFRDMGKRKGVVREVPFGVGKAVRELVPEFEVEGNTWYTFKETEEWIRE